MQQVSVNREDWHQSTAECVSYMDWINDWDQVKGNMSASLTSQSKELSYPYHRRGTNSVESCKCMLSYTHHIDSLFFGSLSFVFMHCI